MGTGKLSKKVLWQNSGNKRYKDLEIFPKIYRPKALAFSMIEFDFSDEELEEELIHSEVVLEGGMMLVKRDQVRLPSGRQGQREYLIHPGAVLVLPVLSNGALVLERQFRFPLRQVFVELPAGKIDPGEDILVTGQRELLEETGYIAEDWVYLGYQHPCIGYSTEVIHMFVAENLSQGEVMRDEDEALQIFHASLNDCLNMIRDGQITDAKTIVALSFYEKYLTGHWTPSEIPKRG
jgi:ADP-ribose pyrophosphatase